MNKPIFKISFLGCFLFFIMLLTSCQNTAKPPEGINTSFTANCQITKEDFLIKCSVTSTPENIIRLYVFEPLELKGLTFQIIDNKYKMSYEGLSSENQDTFLPKISFANIIFNTLKEISNLENLTLLESSETQSTFSGTCDSGYFTVKVNSENLMESILLKDINTEITFDNYT